MVLVRLVLFYFDAPDLRNKHYPEYDVRKLYENIGMKRYRVLLPVFRLLIMYDWSAIIIVYLVYEYPVFNRTPTRHRKMAA